jgi:hypothetical protein
MRNLLTKLPNLSIPGTHFPVLLSTLIRSQFQVKPATLLLPIDLSLFLWWRSFTVPGTKVAPFHWLMWGVIFTICVVFLSVLSALKTLVIKDYVPGSQVQTISKKCAHLQFIFFLACVA